LSEGDAQTQLLLIGPELEMLELLDDVLTDSGFQVSTVNEMGSIEEHLGSPEYDVVVCDELSRELDGLMIFDALVETRSDGDRPPFVLLGDSPEGERIAKCFDREMEEYVIKPFDVAELVARIRKAVRTHRLLAAPTSDEPAGVEEPAEASAGTDAATVGLEGSLDYFTLPDLLMNLHQNGQTGRLAVQVDDGEYSFSFSNGELVKVRGPRGLKSRKAFYRSMRESKGTFTFFVLEQISGRHSSKFSNLANIILQAVQEADEFPLTRNNLPDDPIAVSLTSKVEETPVPENSAIQPLLEGLIKSTTIDILIHACPKTDLEAAKELEELMMAEVLVEKDEDVAERAS
jgi:DNA-binding response OmpR family regulator